MTERDREFGEFIRRSLHAAAESIMIGPDGLDRIHARLAAVRLAGAADPGECCGPAARAGQSWRAWAEPIQSAGGRPLAGARRGRPR
jgi:hypothetical protein